MKGKISRLIVYAADVQYITGRHRRTCYEILEKIRLFYGKKKSSPVTVREFAEFMTISEAFIRESLLP